MKTSKNAQLPMTGANSDASVSATATDHVAPDRSDVEQLAYELWCKRGRPDGAPEDDWFAAEEILKAKSGSAAA